MPERMFGKLKTKRQTRQMFIPVKNHYGEISGLLGCTSCPHWKLLERVLIYCMQYQCYIQRIVLFGGHQLHRQ